MAQRKKPAAAALPEQPARREIGTYDLKDFPQGELIDTGDGAIRRAWQISERVQIVIDGQTYAADPGDFVYELTLPGAKKALEVLQSDVALGMGYEWKPGAAREGWPFPGAPASTLANDAPPIEKSAPLGAPPAGTFDVYHVTQGYLSSITTTPEIGKAVHLAGKGTFYVTEIEDQNAIVSEKAPAGTELALGESPVATAARDLAELAGTAQELVNQASTDEARTPIIRSTEPRRTGIPDPLGDDGEERRAEGVLGRRGADHVTGAEPGEREHVERSIVRRRMVDALATDQVDRREPGNVGRRAEDLTDDERDPYTTSDELTDYGPGAVDLLVRLVKWAKRQTTVFRDLTERQQDNELADLDKMITDGVRALVVDVASRDFPFVHATLEKVEFSDGIKATLSIPITAEHRHELADQAKQTVTVVIVGAATWTSGDRPKAQPDQPRLL